MSGRRGFNFKDSYEVEAQLKRGGWKAASLMAANAADTSATEGSGRTISAEMEAQLESAEEYAQNVASVPWESVDKVVERIITLREEVIEQAEMCEMTMEPEEDEKGAIMYDSMLGKLTISDGESGEKVMTLQKDERADSKSSVVVEIREGDQTVKEVLSDGSSIMLSHRDNILTECFNDGCVSRLDRDRYLKTLQLSSEDGNILIQAVLNGPRKGHITIQCMDGSVVQIDENGTRTMRMGSPRARRRSSTARSPNARPPKGPPPASPKGGSAASRQRARTGSIDMPVDAAAPKKRSGSLFRQLTSEKLVIPTREDEEESLAKNAAKSPTSKDDAKVQWRCIRRLWIHTKPATLSGLVRHMEVGETIVQVRKIRKTVGRTWIEFIDDNPKNKRKTARYVATTSKLGLKTMIPIFSY